LSQGSVVFDNIRVHVHAGTHTSLLAPEFCLWTLSMNEMSLALTRWGSPCLLLVLICSPLITRLVFKCWTLHIMSENPPKNIVICQWYVLSSVFNPTWNKGLFFLPSGRCEVVSFKEVCDTILFYPYYFLQFLHA